MQSESKACWRCSWDPVTSDEPAQASTAVPNEQDLGNFGEYLHRLPSAATEVDKILAAGFYCETISADGSFSTAEANRRLVEHGIKVGNASQCVKQSLTARRVFTLAKGQYKVSQEGRRYLQRLIGSEAR